MSKEKVELYIDIDAKEFIEKIQEFHESKLIDVTKVEIGGESILTYVAENGYVDAFDYLSGLKGVDLKSNDWEALEAAAYNNQLEIIRRYLERFERMLPDECYEMIFEQLPFRKRWDSIKKLFEFSKYRYVFLYLYIPHVESLDDVKYLFDQYPDTKKEILKILDDITEFVARCKSIEVVNYFIDLGIDPNKLVAHAIVNTNENALKASIEKGADINEALKMVLLKRQEKEGCFSINMVEFLYGRGADISNIDQTTLNYAKAIGNTDLVWYLMEFLTKKK